MAEDSDDREHLTRRWLTDGIKYFVEHWNEIVNVLDFDDEWITPPPPNRYKAMAGKYPFIHGCVRLDFIKHLPNGVIFKSISDEGQRIIFVGTRLGPVVLYIHHDLKGNPSVYCVADQRLKHYGLIPMSTNLANPIIKPEIKRLLGTTKRERADKRNLNHYVPNIGTLIETLYEHWQHNGE